VRGLIIDNFTMTGVVLQEQGGNMIAGNYIGVDPSGAQARPNGTGGVLVRTGLQDNTIGGTTAVDRNVNLATSSSSAVYLDQALNNRILGNYVGTDVTGTFRLGPPSSGWVDAYEGSGNTIGGTALRAGNLLAGGVSVTGTSQIIQGNLVGTDSSGTHTLGFGGQISANGADHLIGGTAPDARNLVAGSVYLNNTTGVVVQGNFIGTDITGSNMLGGFLSLSGSGNLIGGTTTGARNVIAGSNDDLGGGPAAVEIGGDHNRVEGNFIGTDVTGTIALRNTGGGVAVDSIFGGPDHDNIIGGTEPGAGNLISGNGGGTLDRPGVRVSGTHNFVEGNFIGTDVTGTRALGNQGPGVALGSAVFGGGSDNVVGGTESGARNIISGNRSRDSYHYTGVAIFINGNRVEGNYMGTDVTGIVALPNDYGVSVGGTDNTIRDRQYRHW
jgi:titin